MAWNRTTSTKRTVVTITRKEYTRDEIATLMAKKLLTEDQVKRLAGNYAVDLGADQNLPQDWIVRVWVSGDSRYPACYLTALKKKGIPMNLDPAAGAWQAFYVSDDVDPDKDLCDVNPKALKGALPAADAADFLKFCDQIDQLFDGVTASGIVPASQVVTLAKQLTTTDFGQLVAERIKGMSPDERQTFIKNVTLACSVLVSAPTTTEDKVKEVAKKLAADKGDLANLEALQNSGLLTKDEVDRQILAKYGDEAKAKIAAGQAPQAQPAAPAASGPVPYGWLQQATLPASAAKQILTSLEIQIPVQIAAAKDDKAINSQTVKDLIATAGFDPDALQ